MTEYWQSQAKKFCDFCKCWITDNKPSIEFHERGKKHKENVARKIKEVHKRGVQTVKDNEELKRNLQAIEDAALEAYKKDVGEEAFNRATQNTTATARTLSSQQKTYQEGATTTTHGETSSAGCTIIYKDGQPVAHCSHCWSIAQSPEGYYYYYNSETLASQWEVPDCLQTPDNDTNDETPKQDEIHAHTSTSEQKEDDKEEEQPDLEKKEDNDKEDKNTIVKTSSPYGAWTTVRTIEPPPPTVSKTITVKDKKTEDSEETEETEDPEVTAKKTENKFKQRETPKITFHKGDDHVIAFKKRKLNNEKKRNIRQTKLN